jgi:hypothetical protein
MVNLSSYKGPERPYFDLGVSKNYLSNDLGAFLTILARFWTIANSGSWSGTCAAHLNA